MKVLVVLKIPLLGSTPPDVMLGPARERRHRRRAAAVAAHPAAQPLGDGWEGPARALTALVEDGRIVTAVELEDRHGRSLGRAVVVAGEVSVQRRGDGRKGGELATVIGRARQEPDKAAPVGVAGRVDTGGIHAERVLQEVNHVAGEYVVSDTFCGIVWSLPVFLRKKHQHQTCFYTKSRHHGENLRLLQRDRRQSGLG